MFSTTSSPGKWPLSILSSQPFAPDDKVADRPGGKNDTYLLTHYGFLHQELSQCHAYELMNDHGPVKEFDLSNLVMFL